MQQLRGSHGPKLTIEDRERMRRQAQEIAQAAFVKHEEQAMGNFERIYPDDDPQRAQVYERVLAGSQQLFGRSATNRRTAAQQMNVKPPVNSEKKPLEKAKEKVKAAANASKVVDALSSTNTDSSSAASSSSRGGGDGSGGSQGDSNSDTPTGNGAQGNAPTPTAASGSEG